MVFWRAARRFQVQRPCGSYFQFGDWQSLCLMLHLLVPNPGLAIFSTVTLCVVLFLFVSPWSWIYVAR